MVKMLKKIVAFDTSLLIDLYEKKINIDIEKEYPKNQYLRVVQDTVIDEFFLNKQGQWRKDRKEKVIFFEQIDICIMESFSKLILQEYIERKNYIDEIYDKGAIILFLEGNHPKQQQMENIYFNNVNKRNQAKYDDFAAIPVDLSSGFCLKVQEIYNNIKNCIDSEKGYSLPIVIYPVFDLPYPTIIEVSNTGMLLGVEYREGRKRYKYPRFFKNLETEFPTIYNLLIYDEFKNRLRRPQNTQLNEKFDINLKNGSDKIINIKIEANTLPDFRISLAALPYIDVFVTSDKHQNKLIKGLYPFYSAKVRLCD